MPAGRRGQGGKAESVDLAATPATQWVEVSLPLEKMEIKAMSSSSL